MGRMPRRGVDGSEGGEVDGGSWRGPVERAGGEGSAERVGREGRQRGPAERTEVRA